MFALPRHRAVACWWAHGSILKVKSCRQVHTINHQLQSTGENVQVFEINKKNHSLSVAPRRLEFISRILKFKNRVFFCNSFLIFHSYKTKNFVLSLV